MEKVDNKKISRGAVFLYIRTILTLLISFFTSRVVLEKLGAENFGIYDLVAGFLLMFTILRGTFSNALQRFINTSIGEDNKEKVKQYFNVGILVYIVVGIIFLLLAESIGLWWVKNKLNLPIGKVEIALYVYQLSIVSVLISIFTVPFDSMVMAHQKMDFYAVISIIEGLYRLLILYLLIYFPLDKLILYSILLLLGNLCFRSIYIIYSRNKFDTCRFSFNFNINFLKNLLSFASWNVLGVLAFSFVNQGINYLFNIFGSVLVNAARAISSQVMSAIMHLVENIILAFKPTIIILCAQKRIEEFNNLILFCSKSNVIMYLILALPIYSFLEFILKIWLGDVVPEYSVEFIRALVIYMFVRVFHNPIGLIFLSYGDIKVYQLIECSILILTLPFAYIILKLGLDFYYVFISMAIVELINLLVIVFYANYKFKFPFYHWLVRIFLAIALPFIIVILLQMYFDNIYLKIILLIGFYMYIYLLYLTKQQRETINKLILKIIKK